MKRKMFCITNVEFLMKSVKENFCCNVNSEVSVRRNSLDPVVSCPAASSAVSFRSSCPPLNFGSLHFDAPYVSLDFRLFEVPSVR